MAQRKKLTSQRKYQLLMQISQQTQTTFDLEQILNILLDEVKLLVDYDAAGIFVLNRTVLPPRLQQPRQVISEVVLRNYFFEEGRNRMMRYGEGLVGHAIRTGECVVIRDVRKDPRYVIGRASTRSEIDVPLFLGDRPIGALNLESDRVGAFSESDADTLRFFADAAAITIDKAMQHANLLEKEQLDRQLKMASAVQSHLLPAHPPQVPGYDIAGLSLPAYEIGGDYFDYIQLPGGRLGLVVADVSGDGMAAALVMASFRALLRTFTSKETDPAQIAETINQMLPNFAGQGDFVSSVFGLFEPDSGRLTYVNCGHNLPILIPHGGQPYKLNRSGPALCMVAGFHYQASQAHLAPGDALLLYTDGLTEARNTQGEFFDDLRLDTLLQENLHRPAADLIQTIIQAARQFSGFEVFSDDLTMIVVKRNPV
ncbi:MAG: SpoIIE family protein phosphatase [Anaerolineales bacterium]|jgi:sigma-B regulation protein RsbU (phosphoserine phosphatase)|nr:SpoIIE family protein phosphatase [Anaerolineales bacterium]